MVFGLSAGFMSDCATESLPVSAFGETVGGLRDLVRHLSLDIPALCRPLRRCDLGRCAGTCCHDGVYLDRAEVGVLRGLIDHHRADLDALGADLPPEPIVAGDWRGIVSGPKTATRPRALSALAEDYPAHFPDTACVFLLPDARCALQQFAVDQGKPPWFYKPATCWLHPLSIDQPGDGGPPTLTLHTPETDPQRFPDYDGFACRTPCGRIAPGGEPAWSVLSLEIGHLGHIGGRDLLGEIRAAAGAAD